MTLREASRFRPSEPLTVGKPEPTDQRRRCWMQADSQASTWTPPDSDVCGGFVATSLPYGRNELSQSRLDGQLGVLELVRVAKRSIDPGAAPSEEPRSSHGRRSVRH